MKFCNIKAVQILKMGETLLFLKSFTIPKNIKKKYETLSNINYIFTINY